MQDASKMAKKVCRGVIGAQSASTNRGDASRVGERRSCHLIELVYFSFIFPTRDEAADKIAVYRVKSSFSSLF